MARKPQAAASILKARIESGDYDLRPIPSARVLADEMGISYVTARRAIQKLIDKGLAFRNETGRLELTHPARPARRLAFICPSSETSPWIHRVGAVAQKHGMILREIGYLHAQDPVISEILCADFDGFFFIPPPDPPPAVLDQMCAIRHKLVTISENYTETGIPCLDGVPLNAIETLMQHLKDLGHRRVHCLSTEYDLRAIRDRIEHWELALQNTAMSGTLFQAPVEPGEDAARKACQKTARLLRSTAWDDASAVFCPTVGVACGVSKALIQNGLTPGKEISVCSFGENEEAWLNNPSITIASNPGLTPCIEKAIRWIETGGKHGDAPLMIRPTETELQIGDSTGPAGTRP